MHDRAMLSFNANEQKRCATHIGSWGPGHTSRGRKLSQATCPPIEARPVTEKCCATSWCAGKLWGPIFGPQRPRPGSEDAARTHLWATWRLARHLGHPWGTFLALPRLPCGHFLYRKAPIRCPVLGFSLWTPLLERSAVALGGHVGQSER